MYLAVPSRGRANKIHKFLDRLPPEWRRRTHVFVPSAEIETYKSRGLGVQVVDDGGGKIGDVRRRIVECAHQQSEKYALMMDDDLIFSVRRDETTTSTRQTNHDDLRQLAGAMIGALDEGYGHVAPAIRLNQNARGAGTHVTLRRACCRLMRFVAWDVQHALTLTPGRTIVMEDFDWSLQSLRTGRNNLELGWWLQDQTATNAPGGCSTYRTAEVHAESARRLAELHPGYVTLVEKHDKHGTLKDRVEVRIAWARAYADSQR